MNDLFNLLFKKAWPPKFCPGCGREGVEFHSLTAWCLSCGWAKNKKDYV